MEKYEERFRAVVDMDGILFYSRELETWEMERIVRSMQSSEAGVYLKYVQIKNPDKTWSIY